MRIIKTARDIESINEAIRNGYRPIIKKVIPSKKIHSKYCVIQNKKTGEIRVASDYRSVNLSVHNRNGIKGKILSLFTDDAEDYESDEVVVIDWTSYYPYNFKSPFAAYLIPKDIVIGERVMVEDLIEDYVGGKWNQGDVFRLESCEAIWNGQDLEIKYDPKNDSIQFVG